VETSAQSRPAAPAVVAVIVTRNPGPWFDEALAAVAAQDYPNLAVLVIDAASDTDPSPRVASALPGAHVRRLGENRGFGASANHVRDAVEGAAFYCFLHDDAAPEPRAISILVGEALRSNAGVVGPKLVHFKDPRRLLQVGESADKTGERVTAVEPGELDQEQHDAVRDVFVVPGACTLVRSDLFEAIDGFDPGIDHLNDDLNLCWRAHVAGGRVMVAPDARVRHVEALADRLPVEARRERLVRHRLRTMLTCYSRWHLFRVLPQAVVLAVAEVVYALVVGHLHRARDVARAWAWNVARRRDLVAWRRKVQAFRAVPDAEIRRLQLRGSSRLMLYLRGQTAAGGSRGEDAQASLRRFVDGARDGSLRWPIVAWLVTSLIVAFGSRHLILDRIPAVGGFPPFDQSPTELLRGYASGWRDVGLGSSSPAPTVLALLATFGLPLLGAMDLLRKLVLLVPIALGLVGAFRLVRPTGSPRARAVALVVYGAIPLAYDAVAGAHWGSVVVYGASPWVIGQLSAAAGWAPWGPGPGRSVRQRILSLGLLLALVAAVEPSVLPLTLMVAVGLVAGSLLVGQRGGVPGLAAVAAGSVGAACVLHLPWSLDLFGPDATWETVVGVSGADEVRDLGALLRFDVGPVGGSALSVGLPLAALLPLLIGRDWRFDWAVRSWCVTLTALGVTWAGAEGWLPVPLPEAEAVLAPAAVGLAVSAAMGVVAFEIDLRRHGFGWRQVAAALAGVALLVGALPTLLDAGDGRWYLPSGGLETTFAFLEDEEEPGFRVLWMGDADVMPVAGYPLDDGLSYATTEDGLPSISDGWPGSPDGATELIERAIDLAGGGETSRLGRLLAPMAVRYVVVPQAAAPAPLGGERRPAPEALLDTLATQLDLARIAVNPAYVVYRNEAALPSRAALGPGLPADTRFPTEEIPSQAEPVLADQTGRTTFEGRLGPGTPVLHSVTADGRWTLEVDGREASRRVLFGWADGYETGAGGDAVLSYDTSPLRHAAVVLQLLLWVVALVALIRMRRPEEAEPVVRRGMEEVGR
jgi:GT2 family glycosyltransferase